MISGYLVGPRPAGADIGVTRDEVITRTFSVKRVTYEGREFPYQEISPLLGCRFFTTGGRLFNGDTIFIDDEGLLVEDQDFCWKTSEMKYCLAGKGLLLGSNHMGESITPKTPLLDFALMIDKAGKPEPGDLQEPGFTFYSLDDADQVFRVD